MEIKGETFKTAPQVLHHWATHQPDTAAFVFMDSTLRRRILTRADVYRLAARFAAILRRNNITRCAVVCNTLPNSPERVVSDFGIMLAGAIAMNGQIFLADGADFIGSLKDCKCKAVILDPLQPKGAMSLLASLGTEELREGTVHIQGLPALQRIFHCHWEKQGEISSFMDMLEKHQDSYVEDVSADDIACIWSTSGNTGFSKLFPHTHSSFLRVAWRFSVGTGIISFPEPFTYWVKTLGLSTADISMEENFSSSDAFDVDFSHHAVLNSFKENTSNDAQAEKDERVTHCGKNVFFNNGKLGWSGGFPAGFLAVGATRVLADLSHGPPSDPEALTWTMIRQEQCKFVFMLPYHLQQLLSREDLWKSQPWKISALGLTGQPVHASLVKNAMENITDSVNVFYGSTEFGAMTCNAVLDPCKYEDCNNGKPIPGVGLKVVGEDLKELSSSSGKLGEIIIHPGTEKIRYVNNEVATQKMTLPGRWFRTGDVGYFNDEGDLFVVCRSSFVIMRGAFILYPGWLEARISTHPAVESVLVVPVPVLHQELCACVVTKPGASLTAEELREFCQTLLLTDSSGYITAVPRYYLFFSTFPTNSVGKPCRHKTTQEAFIRLGL